MRRQLFNDTLEAQEEEHDVEVYLALFLCFTTIFLGLVLASWVRQTRLSGFLSDAGLLLLLGALVGSLVHMADNTRIVRAIEKMTWFDGDILFIVLLPPIIFNSGYNTSSSRFYANFGAISLFAFVGTAIAAAITGLLVYSAGKSNWIFELNAVESMTFGSMVSATDPVTVLAVFQQLGVDADLYAVVFGESVLNDAVAIVLFKTMLVFENKPVSFPLVLEGLWSFVIIFLGSFAIGVIMGCLNALVIKYMSSGENGNGTAFEMAAVVLFPYMAYCLAEGLSLSGIVSILFCGFSTSHYANHNLSKEAEEFTKSLFSTLSHIAEAFLFIYLGMAVFDNAEGRDEFSFSVFSLFAVLIARVVAIVPLTLILNYICRCSSKKIGFRHAFALWISGLRGAIAYALAAKAARELDDDGGTSGRVMESATMFITFFTILVIGGIMPWLTKVLKLKASEPASPMDPGEIEMTEMDRLSTARDLSPDGRRDSQQGLLRRLDENFIKPLLTRQQPRTPEVYDSSSADHITHEGNSVDTGLFEPVLASSNSPTHRPSLKQDESRGTTEISLM